LCDPLSGSALPEGGGRAWVGLVVTVQYAGGSARGRRQGLAGLRAEPKARGADGERAGCRPRARRAGV